MKNSNSLISIRVPFTSLFVSSIGDDSLDFDPYGLYRDYYILKLLEHKKYSIFHTLNRLGGVGV